MHSWLAPFRRLLVLVLLVGTRLPCPLLAQSWIRADPRPLLDVSGTDASGTVLLGMPVGATRLASGEIAVADAALGGIRYFDRNGRFDGQVGRMGDGPGEFRNLSWLGRCARDSLVVWDLGHQRLTTVTANRKVVGQRQFPSDRDPNAPVPAYLACSQTGRFVYLGRPTQIGEQTTKRQFERTTAPLVIAPTVETPGRIVDTVPVAEIAFANGSWYPRPLGRTTQLAVAGDDVVLGTSDSGVVHILGENGQPVRSIKMDVKPRAPNQVHLARAADQVTMYLTGPLRDGFRKTLLQLPPPRELPPYSAVLADATRNVWIVVSVPGDDSTRVHGFDSHGARIGELVLRADVTIHEISSDYLLGTYEDDVGEVHLVVYRIARS